MILGTVCEFNPFHNGHRYLLEKSRAGAGEDAVFVCAMSGDYVQRGEAAAWPKALRAEAACRGGADLVVELPLPWSLSSAEGFARGAVALLAALGVERLCFGSESGDAAAISGLAAAIADPAFIEAVKARLKRERALSFAAARQKEAEARFGETGALLAEPNDILAVEYAKAILLGGYAMEPFAVKRVGSGHDRPGDSASALRERYEKGESLSGFVPGEAASLFQSAPRRDARLFEAALLSRLRLLDEAAFCALPDAADGLGQRLFRAVREEGSLGAICAAAQTRRYPLARVRRACLAACLGLRAGMADGVPSCARVLAANEKGRALLRKRAAGPIPLLTKPATVRALGAEAEALFSLGAAAHDLYVLGYADGALRKPGEDWREKPYLGE